MFVPVGEVVRRSLQLLLDELIDMLHDLPEGETKRKTERRVAALEDLIVSLS